MSYRSYERDSVYPSFQDPFFREHLERYLFLARPMCEGRRVLEVGCGRGYGSHILAAVASHVDAIDLNQESLAFARAHYRRKNLAFHEAALSAWLDEHAGAFDVVICFEVLEHIEPRDARAFVADLARALKPQGCLLLSTPNHDVTQSARSPVPEFHIHNLGPDGLRGLLLTGFREVRLLGQTTASSPLSLGLLALDRWNLRHALRRALRGPRASASTPTPNFATEAAWVDGISPRPDRTQRFSRWISRQGSSLIAIARR